MSFPLSMAGLVGASSADAAALVEKAAQRPATASSVQDAAYPASGANDDSTSTRWSSAFSDGQHWTVDLGSARLVSEVRVNWESAYASTYKIQTSLDGVSFTDAAQATASGAGEKATTFGARPARYVRLLGGSRGTAWGISFWELKVYGPEDAALVEKAAGKAATASSVQAAGYEPAKANDSSSTTRYSSASSDGQWWQVDLGAPRAVSQVKVNWEHAYASRYKIQTSIDGKTWSDTAVETASGAGERSTTFATRSARYVRVLSVTRGTAWGISFWDVKVLGGADATTAAQAPAPTPAPTATPTPSPTPAPSGTIRWQTNFSGFAAGATGPFAPAFEDTPWNVYGGGSVGIVSDAIMGKVLRSYGAANQGRDGSQRAEQVPSIKLYQGDVAWIRFDLWANADLGVSNTWQSVAQIKTGGAADQTPPVSLDLNAFGEAGLAIASARMSGSEPTHHLGGPPKGQWTRIVLGVHTHTDPAKAWIEVWRDGANVLPREPWRAINQYGGNTVGGTMFPGGNGEDYLKFGVYRGPQGFAADVRYANFAVGTTRESVM
jgi:hypothetical protein